MGIGYKYLGTRKEGNTVISLLEQIVILKREVVKTCFRIVALRFNEV